MSESGTIRLRAAVVAAIAVVLLVLTYQVFAPLPTPWSIQDVWQSTTWDGNETINFVVITVALIVYLLAVVVFGTVCCVGFKVRLPVVNAIGAVSYAVFFVAALVMTFVTDVVPTHGRWTGSWAASWSMLLAAWVTLITAKQARKLMDEAR